MFLINNGVTYEVTRDLAMKKLCNDIEKKLEPYFDSGILDEVVKEIKNYISFPDIMDSYDVYVHQNGVFFEVCT